MVETTPELPLEIEHTEVVALNSEVVVADESLDRKSQTQIAGEVWAGLWGTGSDRVDRLTKAGYNPETIQTLVNCGVGKTSPIAMANREE